MTDEPTTTAKLPVFSAPLLPLTRERIVAATGRDLDLLVAEYVMGWRWITKRYVGLSAAQEPHVAYNVFCEPTHQGASRDWEVLPFDATLARGNQWSPYYSKEHNPAALVLERMDALDFYWEAHGSRPCIYVRIGKGCDPCTVDEISQGAPLPECVSRCALLAILAETRPKQ